MCYPFVTHPFQMTFHIDYALITAGGKEHSIPPRQDNDFYKCNCTDS